jgi:hypothetical protein
VSSNLWIVFAVILLLSGIGKRYLNDLAAVEDALVVDKFFKDYCRMHKMYPEIEALETRFPELYRDGEWYYWPNETRTAATFQYPMTLSLSRAPGRSKFSEFIPIIYAYVVRHPYEGIL